MAGQVTQTDGTAVIASAGYHNPESTIDGHPFSSCTDLDFALASDALVDHLISAGVCPFVRESGNGWNGSSHIHCVTVGLRDRADNVTILPGPRMQIIDYCRGRNGLVGHAALACYVPTADQRASLYARYSAWAPSVATKVLSPEGGAIPCYAFLEPNSVGGQTARCEARGFLEFWGATIKAGTSGPALAAEYKGAEISLAAAYPCMEGDFTRADVRGLAEALRLGISFDWSADKSSAVVKLAYE